MKAFTTPQWESNPAAEKTCKELFKKPSGGQKIKHKKKKNEKSEIKDGRIEKAKSKKKLKSKIKNTFNRSKPNELTSFNQNSNNKDKSRSDLIKNSSKVKKHKKQKLKNHDSIPQNTPMKHDKRIALDNDSNKRPQKQKKSKPNGETSFNQNSNNKDKDGRSDVIKNSSKIKKHKQKFKNHDSIPQNTPMKHDKRIALDNDINERPRKQKKNLTHQTLFTARSKLYKSTKANINTDIDKRTNKNKKKFEKSNIDTSNKSVVTDSRKEFKKVKYMQEKRAVFGTLSRKQMAALPLRERMLEKLKSARFRYLNEQMYTSMGKDAKKYFEGDPDAYTAYHEGYQQQVARWPLNPVDVIIEKIRKLPRTHIIADFGCGEAKLAKSVPHTVHSFDLVALNEHVTACDMAHVPLENDSVNVVVFCLSLMGTNLKEYLMEAHRVLKISGMLKIAEVESRFDNVDSFIKEVQSFGFNKIGKDLSQELFCFLDFVKKEANIKQKKKLPDVNLNPCLYKKR